MCPGEHGLPHPKNGITDLTAESAVEAVELPPLPPPPTATGKASGIFAVGSAFAAVCVGGLAIASVIFWKTPVLLPMMPRMIMASRMRLGVLRAGTQPKAPTKAIAPSQTKNPTAP